MATATLGRRVFNRFVQISAFSFSGIAVLSADTKFNGKKIQNSVGSVFRTPSTYSATASNDGIRKEDKSKRPKVGLGCLILRKNKDSEDIEFLVGVRRSSHGEGLYALPGGHLEYSESWGECAYNETKEETNLEIPPSDWKFAYVTNSISPPKQQGDEDLHYIDIVMSTVYEGEEEPTNAEPEKCEGWKWVKWNDHQLETQRTFCALKAILSVKDFDPLHTLSTAVAFDQWEERKEMK